MKRPPFLLGRFIGKLEAAHRAELHEAPKVTKAVEEPKSELMAFVLAWIRGAEPSGPKKKKRKGKKGRRWQPGVKTDELQKRRDRVEAQKDFINKRFLEQREWQHAKTAVLELGRNQKNDGAEPGHFCMSLCDIAATATENGGFDFALELYEVAAVANPWDAVPSNGYAETLRKMARFEDALVAYTDAKERFLNDAVPFNGYAETLRNLGRFDEALAAYAEAKENFSNNAFPFTGYAETLRQSGRLDEALAAYAEVKECFSNDVVPFNGYAGTLRQLGRFDEALAAYAEAKESFSSNAFPFTGYAETLRQLNRLDEALAAYAEAKERFSDNAVPFNGYAETLRQLNHLDEALIAYAEAKERFSNNAVPFNGYAETLRQMGRFDEALLAYTEAKKNFSNSAFPFAGYAETLRQLGRFSEAELEYRAVSAKFPNERVVHNALGCLLIDQGKFADAKRILAVDSPKSHQDWRDWHVVAMGYLRNGELAQAREMFDEGMLHCSDLSSRQYFENGLALVDLKKCDREAVARLLRPEAGSAIVVEFPARKILGAQLHVIEGRLGEARAAADSLKRYAEPLVEAWREDMERRWFSDPMAAGPERDELDERIWVKQCDILLRPGAVSPWFVGDYTRAA